MRIRNIEAWEFPLTLRESYTIAYHTVSKVTNVALLLHMADGLTGLGCAGPEEEVTQETADTVLKASEEIIKPLLLNATIDSIEETWKTLSLLLKGQQAALAMTEMALFDYFSKKAALPLYRYLGASRTHLKTSITVNIHSPEETLSRVKGWIEKGFTILKLKGGLSLDDDIKKINLIRNAYGLKLPIIFDANQGYSLEDASTFSLLLKNQNILCIEQPLHKESIQSLIELAKQNVIPVMVDESLRTEEDALLFAKEGVRFFNIKLMKSGGIIPSKKIATIANNHGSKVIVSCMDECAYVNAAGLHFSLAQSNIDFVDLDSFTDYTEDPTCHSIVFKDGSLWTKDLPGIGFDFPS